MIILVSIDMINKAYIKNRRELEAMRSSGKINASLLKILSQKAVPGVTLLELNKIAEDFLSSKEFVAPVFNNVPNDDYDGGLFPGVVTLSINAEAFHGTPRDIALQDGDILTIDAGVIYRKMITDAAVSIIVGNPKDESHVSLIKDARNALIEAIDKFKLGAHLGDVVTAAREYLWSRGYGVGSQFMAHGVGNELHEEPRVDITLNKGEGEIIVDGMTVAIEPLAFLSSKKIVKPVMSDNIDDYWTTISEDNSLSAQFEATVGIVDGETVIFTPVID